MTYKHGIYMSEKATSLASPVTSTAGMIVAVGTAPVNLADDPYSCTNKPMLAYSATEAEKKVGYNKDFENYTLCQVIAATFAVVAVAPIVLINVLDPAVHKADLAPMDYQINNGVTKISTEGILLDKLVVKAGTVTLTSGVDYTAAFDDNGFVNIAVISGGKADAATALNVAGVKIDPSKITATDIIGAVDAATGSESGIEAIREVFPSTSLVPGILLAPKWSKDATVSAALQAKCEDLNGAFKAVTFVDIDSSTAGAKKYTDVKSQKTKQGLDSAYAFAIWPCVKADGLVYSGSAMAAALAVYTDSQNNDIPNVSPSNKEITISAACLEDGTEVLMDIAQANVLNSYGIATWLNFSSFRLWGDHTSAYPENTDPKDTWLSVRRFINWRENNFVVTYFNKIDNPGNLRLTQSIVDSENIIGNGYVAAGICAGDQIQFLESENPTSSLMAGKVTFHHMCTPYPPIEVIDNTFEFSLSALQSQLTIS